MLVNGLIRHFKPIKLLGPDGEMICVCTLQSAVAGLTTDKVAFF